MITTTVTGKIKTSAGDVVENAEIIAKLSNFDYDPDDGYVTDKKITTQTDTSGEFSFELWPNTRGEIGSNYRVVIKSPVPGISASYVAIVPEQASVSLQEAIETGGTLTEPDSNIQIVVDNIDDISTVSTNISNVVETGSNILDIQTVATELSNSTSSFSVIADNMTDINGVAANISDVQSVAAIDNKVTVVADNITDVTSVGDTTIARNAYQDAIALSNNGIEHAVIFGV